MTLVIPPYGISPLGLFTVEELEFISIGPPGVLADLIDYGETDQAKPGRRPTFDILSLTVGLHPIDEQVLTAMTLVKNSGAAALNDGAEFNTVRKLTSTAGSLLVSIGTNALKRLIDAGDIDLISMKPEVDGDAAQLTTTFRNLRASDSQRARTLKTSIGNSGNP